MADHFSPDLLWEITRKRSSLLVKRKQSGGVAFSTSPLNLLNKHTRKHEGLINSTAIGLSAHPKGGITLTTKKAGKAHQPAQAHQTTTFAKHVGARKMYASVVGQTAKRGYRMDLRREAVARASALKRAAAGKQGKCHEVKLRGAKARKVKEVEKV